MILKYINFKSLAPGGQVAGWPDGWEGGWVRGRVDYKDNSATLWPILQADTCQIFSQAEIPRWAECGDNAFVSSIALKTGMIYNYVM